MPWNKDEAGVVPEELVNPIKLCDIELNMNNWDTYFSRLSLSRVPGSWQHGNSEC